MAAEIPPPAHIQYTASPVLPYVRDSLIWANEEEVEKEFSQAQTQIDTSIERFIALSAEGASGEAYTLWSDLVFDYFSFLLSAYKTQRFSPSTNIQEAIPEKIATLQEWFQKCLLDDPRLLQTFIAHASLADQLTPQQRAFTESILKEYRVIKSDASLEDLERALSILATEEKAAFAFALGTAEPLDPDSLDTLSIFTANIICFPGNLPYTYGGICPWEQRIDQLVETIINVDAPIVTLQEVWDPRAMRALTQKLQAHYAYFVYAAGDPAGTIHVDKMGYNSGLFIASKLPLDQVKFEKFVRSMPQGSNRGTLLVTSRVAHAQFSLINTHLQHGNDPEQIAIRKEQLAACAERLGEKSSAHKYLVGDLNINALTGEHEASALTSLFLLTQENIESTSPTCTEYFNDLVSTPLEQRFLTPKIMEHLDYCVSPVKLPIKQELVPLFSLESPTQALSDHQGLLTTWRLVQLDRSL